MAFNQKQFLKKNSDYSRQFFNLYFFFVQTSSILRNGDSGSWKNAVWITVTKSKFLILKYVPFCNLFLNWKSNLSEYGDDDDDDDDDDAQTYIFARRRRNI